MIKTSNPDISISTDPTYSNVELDNLLKKLTEVNESKVSTSLMKKFLLKTSEENKIENFNYNSNTKQSRNN